MKTNYKAFTLLEVLITIIITGIIIALTYTLFSLVNKQMALFEKENTQVIQYQLFNSTMKYDINNAHRFTQQENQLNLVSYDEVIIAYIFDADKILRTNKNQRTDTFKIKVINKDYIKASIINDTQVLQLTLGVLNDTIYTNYLLKKEQSFSINQQLLNAN